MAIRQFRGRGVWGLLRGSISVLVAFSAAACGDASVLNPRPEDPGRTDFSGPRGEVSEPPALGGGFVAAPTDISGDGQPSLPAGDGGTLLDAGTVLTQGTGRDAAADPDGG